MKKLILLNCAVLLVLAVFAFLFLGNSSEKAFAQGDNAKSSNLTVAVVNFSKIMKRAEDIRKLEELIAKYNDLLQKEAQSLQKKIKIQEDNLRSFEDDPDKENNQDYKDAQEKYMRLLSEYSALKDTSDFYKKSQFLTYSQLFLDKILHKIRLYSDGRYDIVYKVINPTSKELEEMGDAMKLQLEKAREILFYNESKIHDITNEITRLVNNDKDKNVSIALEAAIKNVEKEIAKIK